MKIKYFISFIIIGFAAVGFINLTNKIFAQEIDTSSIQYPVKELGDCKDQADCKSYCDNPENIKVCVDFAENNNLMSDEEIQIAKNFIAAGSKGPGDCKGKDDCEQYCNDISHIDECISFAENNNLMSPKELEEAKKVQTAIARGVKPPPCGNKKACDAYCGASDHMEECITFGAAAGFIQGEELEDAQKMLQALKRGVKPPNCNGKEACDEYCGQPDNMEVCINFAVEAGFMNEQEKADSQKMLEALKKGVKPPNCNGKEACDEYCGQEEHFEECINFAIAAGFMSAEDAEMARKTGGKGPGDCKGKDECEAFCNNPDNQEICFNFAKDNGMIPEEDLRQMEQGKQQLQQALQQAPQAVIDCLNAEVGADMVEKMKNGVMPSRELGDKMQTCFRQMAPPPGSGGGPGEGGAIPPAGQAGPGGCKTPEECQNFCNTNPQECQNFQQQMAPGSPMPGGDGGGTPPAINPNCTGPDCQQFPSQMVNPVPCEGENCQFAPPTGYQQPPSQEQIQQIQQQQIQQQIQQQMQQQPPSENPPPPPSSLLNSNLFLGSIIQGVLKVFSLPKD